MPGRLELVVRCTGVLFSCRDFRTPKHIAFLLFSSSLFEHLSRGFHRRKFGRAQLVAMPRRTLACALLLLGTSPRCRAPLTFVRTAASAGWNQTLPGTDDPDEDGLSLVLHVSHV